MALRHSFTLPSDLAAPQAYSRITNVTYTKDELTVDVETHATEQARLDNKPSIGRNSYMLTWTETPSMNYCYTKLKEEPDFSGSTDC